MVSCRMAAILGHIQAHPHREEPKTRPHDQVTSQQCMHHHLVLTLYCRLLQHWFRPEQSFFVIVLRHPLATMRDLWEIKGKKEFNFLDCGESALKHWLKIQDSMFRDLKFIQNRVVFHFERFALGDSQGLRLDIYHLHGHALPWTS